MHYELKRKWDNDRRKKKENFPLYYFKEYLKTLYILT